MKNLITLIAITLLTVTATFANNTPEAKTMSVETLEIFESVDFDNSSEVIEFSTLQTMSTVQIYNDAGEMTFVLPIMSDNVQINKNLFEKGNYKLGFILAGQSEVHFTTVSFK